MSFVFFDIFGPNPIFKRLDLIVELLGRDSVPEQLLAIFDAPKHLAAVVVQLLVELGNVVLQVSPLVGQILLEFSESVPGQSGYTCFSKVQLVRELRLGDILELGSLELCQALFSLLFEFPILDGDS